jgi:hypothetical protein
MTGEGAESQISTRAKRTPRFDRGKFLAGKYFFRLLFSFGSRLSQLRHAGDADTNNPRLPPPVANAVIRFDTLGNGGSPQGQHRLGRPSNVANFRQRNIALAR